MIVIGLGTDRLGTASLAKLLNERRDAACFHEMNPACVRFCDAPKPILNSIDEFQKNLNGGSDTMLTVDMSRTASTLEYDRFCTMPRTHLLGDIALYYLS